MKIALYIEDGLEQVVLTPESSTEKSILGKLHDGSRQLSINRGSFYECRGGYMRYGVHYSTGVYGGSSVNDESTMIVLRPAAAAEKHHPDCPVTAGINAPCECNHLSDGAEP